MMQKPLRLLAGLGAALMLSGCVAIDEPEREQNNAQSFSIVTGSTVVASLIDDMAGEYVSVTSIVPNAVDAHTYEPLPSEAAAIETADLIVLADAELNPRVTELVEERKNASTDVVYLNETTLADRDYIYIDYYTQRGKNPHTWTNLRYAWYWTQELAAQLSQYLPEREESIAANAAELQNEINALHTRILDTMVTLPAAERNLVVYHDAWEYFGREYGINIVGSLQAVDYSEPSPAQLAEIVDQIIANDVKAFYGSEVFPSDVLETIQRETGARYVSDLSDDALPAPVGTRPFLYVELMENNFDLILQGLNA